MIVLAASSNDVAPGTLGFLVVAGMGLVLFFLFRSMSRHLRKVADQARQADQAHQDGEAPAPADDPARADDIGAAGRDPRQPG